MRGQPQCGTTAAYQQHLRRREVPCRWCTDINTRYHRERSQRGKCAPGLGWPLAPGTYR